MDLVLRAWTGKERLWLVFWLYLVAGSTVYTVLVRAFLLLESRKDVPLFVLILLSFIFSSVVRLVYTIWIAVSLWRCAPNAAWRGWTTLVRGALVVVIGGIALVFSYVFLVAP